MNSQEQKEYQKCLDQFGLEQNPKIHRKISTGKSGAEVYIVQITKKDDDKIKKIPSLIKISSIKEGTKEIKAYEKASKLLADENNYVNSIPKVIDIKEFENMHAVMYEFAGSGSSFTLNEAITRQMVVDYEKIMCKVLRFRENWDTDYMGVKTSAFDAIIETLGKERWERDKLITPIMELGVDTNSRLIGLAGGVVLPNPLIYLYNENLWKDTELDIYLGHVHGDFHGNNIIVKNKRDKVIDLAIIDFAELKGETNIYYDSRYLELHLLLDCFPIESFQNQDKWMQICEYLTRDLAKEDDTEQKVEIPEGIAPFDKILPHFGEEYLNSYDSALIKDYLPSYYLAGLCAGLVYARRKKIDIARRFAAFIYASYNLRELMRCLKIDLPTVSSLPLEWPIDRDGQELNRLLEEGKFDLFAQPIINTRTGKVDFVEVLTRFLDSKKRPDEWFDVARRYNLLDRLSILTCQKLVSDFRYFEGLNLSGVFFNLEADLPKKIIRECLRILKKCPVPVTIEITEHVKKDPQLWKKICDEEQMSIAIDDFGDNTATDLEEILVLKPDFVKMKMKYVDHYYEEISNNLDREYIRKLMVEQVEEKSDLLQLTQVGIKYVQGYLFAIPQDIRKLPIDQWNKGFLQMM
ncbi:EAL domain-containing protein [Peribacillus sp. NPDC060253]|uniref:EAL domain-containing protein n=1 Tax=Peribacillus sp. NPDC060253 TaxID=3347084 RepID=UPI003667D249